MQRTRCPKAFAAIAAFLLVATRALACPPDSLAAMAEPLHLHAEWKEWSLEKWNSLSGKTVRLERDGESVRQSVLAFSEFAPNEQKLIRLILDRSRNRKFVNRNAARYAGAWERVEEVAALIGQSRAEVERMMETIARSPQVELGAWVLETKSGKRYCGLVTSSEAHRIHEEVLTAAYDAMVFKYRIATSDLKDILFFHNHPEASPASSGDFDSAKRMKDRFARRGLDVGVWLYAIAEKENTPVLFHVGF